MINQVTFNKLIEMRLTAMADAFRIQTDDAKMADVPFDDRFGMLVDVEYTSRKNNRLKRLIKSAHFEVITGKSLSPVQPEVVRHTWPARSEWKHAKGITLSNMSGCRIFY